MRLSGFAPRSSGRRWGREMALWEDRSGTHPTAPPQEPRNHAGTAERIWGGRPNDPPRAPLFAPGPRGKRGRGRRGEPRARSRRNAEGFGARAAVEVDVLARREAEGRDRGHRPAPGQRLPQQLQHRPLVRRHRLGQSRERAPRQTPRPGGLAHDRLALPPAQREEEVDPLLQRRPADVVAAVHRRQRLQRPRVDDDADLLAGLAHRRVEHGLARFDVPRRPAGPMPVHVAGAPPQLEEDLGPASALAQEDDVGGGDEGEDVSGHAPTVAGRRRLNPAAS